MWSNITRTVAQKHQIFSHHVTTRYDFILMNNPSDILHSFMCTHTYTALLYKLLYCWWWLSADISPLLFSFVSLLPLQDVCCGHLRRVEMYYRLFMFFRFNCGCLGVARMFWVVARLAHLKRDCDILALYS